MGKNRLIARAKVTGKSAARLLYPFTRRIERGLSVVHGSLETPSKALDSQIKITDIRDLTLQFLQKMRITRGEEFCGYRHSNSTNKPILYGTLAALLINHLYGVNGAQTREELDLVLKFQSDDGLFRDPVIACKMAETEDWWGWRHLTLHALMTLALYEVPAPKEIRYFEKIVETDRFVQYLHTRDWWSRVAWTSNELQNLGVMLQYARDYQNCKIAGSLLDIMYDFIDKHQDPQTGLYGHRFSTPTELSLGVQAGYHFWLLYWYDRRPINHVESIIDNILKTQNILGGYGVPWNSSACEDIDSVDPLCRFSRITDYRRGDILVSLRRALPAILHNLNGDGGWVFRRHEPQTIVHRQMFSSTNESNMFYSWFRTLGLAYCLESLGEVPPELAYEWNFSYAPGHQFL